MLSLVNYGSSDSENEDEKDDQPEIVVSPVKKTNTTIEEEDDEFLHKKEINREIKPPPPPRVPKPREKVKIMISKLSDFKDDDDDEGENRKAQHSSNKKTGLLRLLPNQILESVLALLLSLKSHQYQI